LQARKLTVRSMKALFATSSSFPGFIAPAHTQTFNTLEKLIPGLQSGPEHQPLDQSEAFDRSGPKMASMICINQDVVATAEAMGRDLSNEATDVSFSPGRRNTRNILKVQEM